MAQQTGAIYHQGILYSGGSGTNVTPNPQGEATDTLNTVEIDGTVYGIEGGGGTVLVDSAIDESRRLFASSEITKFNQTPVTYTATEDCYAICIFKGSTGTNMYPIINGKSISFIALNDMISTILPLKKGDVISNRYDEVSENCYFKMFIYGRKLAGAISAPVIYSDEERQIGVWRDNKPLYQKTFYFATPVQVQANRYETLVTSSGLNIETIVSGEALPSKEATFTPISLTYTQNGDIQGYFPTAWSISYLTVRYTKTTDVAGSGEYNTLAIPNVHYSTEEQVIGTWIDGKTLYQKTFEVATTTKGDWVVIINDASILIKEYKGKTCFANGNRINVDHFIDTSNYGTGLILNNGHQFQAIVYNTVNNMDKYIITLKYTKTTD